MKISVERISVLCGVLALCASAALILQKAFATSCGTANLSLGNGWTLVDCNAVSGAVPYTVSLSLSHGQAVRAHSTIVVLADADQSNDADPIKMSGTMSCSDNAGDTFTQTPMGDDTFPNTITSTVINLGYWYTLDSNPKAYDYQATCTFATPGTTRDLDMSVMVFRRDSGLPSGGIDTYIPWHNSVAANAPCPCEIVPGGQTLTVNHPGDLVLAGGNMYGGYAQVDFPFAGVDGDGSYRGPAYYTAGVTSSGPQTLEFHWYTDVQSAAAGSTMFALLDSSHSARATHTQQPQTSGLPSEIAGGRELMGK
jgi:hypothetical protein